MSVICSGVTSRITFPGRPTSQGLDRVEEVIELVLGVVKVSGGAQMSVLLAHHDVPLPELDYFPDAVPVLVE